MLPDRYVGSFSTSIATRHPANMEDFMYQTAILDLTDLTPRFANFTEESVSVFGEMDDAL